MPKAISIVSQFHNLPTGDLLDQLGGLKAAIADLEKRQKALRDELLSRAVDQVEGAQFGATITHSVRWSLDTKAIRSEMGEGWYDQHWPHPACGRFGTPMSPPRLRMGSVEPMSLKR